MSPDISVLTDVGMVIDGPAVTDVAIVIDAFACANCRDMCLLCQNT